MNDADANADKTTKDPSLKNELQQLVVPEEDTVCIYYLASSKYAGKEQIGTVLKSTNII